MTDRFFEMVGDERSPWLKLDGGFEFVESTAVASVSSPTSLPLSLLSCTPGHLQRLCHLLVNYHLHHRLDNDHHEALDLHLNQLWSLNPTPIKYNAWKQ